MHGQADELALPRARLYVWHTSYLAIVPQICIFEKGYSDDEYELHSIDVAHGENFSPAYLRVNKQGQIPTLLVPRATRRPGEERFHLFDEFENITDFLDVSKPPLLPTAERRRPAPLLNPPTATERAQTYDLTSLLLHSDLNFLELTARDTSELRAKQRGAQGTMLAMRKAALRSYIAQVHEDAKSAGWQARSISPDTGILSPSPGEMLSMLEDRLRALQTWLDVYQQKCGEQQLLDYFTKSRNVWTISLPSTLAKVETGMVGPYYLGDDLTMADIHLIAWLARIVVICGGTPSMRGIEAVEPFMGGFRVGSKLKIFWGHWVQRSSFKRLIPTLFSNPPTPKLAHG